MIEQAFFYVDGIPTKGIWIDLDTVGDFDGVLEQLVEAGICGEGYDGDVLVAAVEGTLARHFLGKHGCFDFDGFIAARDAVYPDSEVIAAWLQNGMDFDLKKINEAYAGRHDSWEAFAEDLADQLGYLDQMPEGIRCYFDAKAFGRDLRIGGDYFEVNGYYFRGNV